MALFRLQMQRSFTHCHLQAAILCQQHYTTEFKRGCEKDVWCYCFASLSSEVCFPIIYWQYILSQILSLLNWRRTKQLTMKVSSFKRNMRTVSNFGGVQLFDGNMIPWTEYLTQTPLKTVSGTLETVCWEYWPLSLTHRICTARINQCNYSRILSQSGQQGVF